MDRPILLARVFPALAGGVRAFGTRRSHMASLRVAVLLAALAPLAVRGLVAPERAAAVQAIELPEIPAPVAVALDARTTALLVLDLPATACAQPPCSETVIPAVVSLVDRAHRAGALVIWTLPSDAPADGSVTFRPELGPRPDEAVIGTPVGKFNNTALDQTLRDGAIETAILVGVRANSAGMYTALEANLRGYTVVVADDGMFSDDFGMLVARYQLLNHGAPATRNPDNRPLAPWATTLSRSDLIAFTE